ncbi:DRTGG domain-containing protein [Effusibacillus dendaii]|uniref:Thioesterase n=1 Tax=Effusibacillus dendaii TaxID=2743772 RepID=A0A7I8DD36_9BACL|nr:DRTGG domain-containing protein [Effusibacillus dendaii]BCJ88015.1 thioesterase [Effusibacillus dendaii]
MSTTKHEQILEYIESLEIGSKISVRQVAKHMGVSEGTAYRAIKEAEVRGIATTIERVGTVRIEKQQKKDIERLTYAEVVNIVDGTVLGGANGLHKTLQKFVIGAMQVEAMVKYIDPDSLLIVGNRDQVHKIALEQGAAVLITGGFDASPVVKALADKLELPIISSAYDTFTVASLINRAIYDRLIKKDIVIVEDILQGQEPAAVMHPQQTVADWHQLVESTGHSRFPVVDSTSRVVGMVTSKDVSGQADDTVIEKLMTRNPFTVTPKTSVASTAHKMIWEGIELLPVVDGRKLVGVISRQDVIKGLQYIQKQPHTGDTIKDLILRHFREERHDDKSVALVGEVTPQMTNSLGGVLSGVLMTLISEAGKLAIRRFKNTDMSVENVTVFFLRPIQIDSEITIRAEVIDLGRKFGKADIEIFHEGERMAKALLTAQVLDR